MPHPAIVPGAVAVITGGASGIGLAAAKRFLAEGLKVCIADMDAARLEDAVAALERLAPRENIIGAAVDVASAAELRTLEQTVRSEFGGTDILMNNAGIQPQSDVFNFDKAWESIFAVNLWGIIHGTQAFVPEMLSRQRPGLVINTGSKQGITTPPGNPAYNVAKAGVKAFTEALQHSLREVPDCRISAHLLIPGFVWTGLTRNGRDVKPAAAWTPEQTVDFMMERLADNDFYILCPDNDVPRRVDDKRILWAAGDIVENRPALSRWHPDYAEAFAAFVESDRKSDA